MSLRDRLRVVVVCVALQMGVITGVPMVPDRIRELLMEMNQPTLAHLLPADENDGSGNDVPPTVSRETSC
jgi:hypothetical protein